MLKKVVLWVIAIHLIWIGSVAIPLKRKASSTKKLVVQTLYFKPSSVPKKVASAASSKKEVVKSPPIKKDLAQKPQLKKKEPLSSSSKAAIEPKPKHLTKPSQEKKEEKQVLKKEEIKIEKPLPKIEHNLEVPAKLEELRIENSEGIFFVEGSNNFTEEDIVTFLQAALHLPEYGEVKIQITILSDGSFGKMVVLKSESVKNEKYLREKLPLLTFPYLQENFVKEKSFIMTFCNEI